MSVGSLYPYYTATAIICSHFTTIHLVFPFDIVPYCSRAGLSPTQAQLDDPDRPPRTPPKPLDHSTWQYFPNCRPESVAHFCD